MTNLVLCGGTGSRLWPLSRNKLPKQFSRILPEQSFFEATVRRNRELCSKLFIASNREQYFLAANQLRSMGINSWRSLIEPMGRNTAPAIALACMAADEHELFLVCPSDHAIKDDAAYTSAVLSAMDLAEKGYLVTFGIKPEYPETGFGYIEADSLDPNRVRSFREKPDRGTAQTYLDAGNYYWNSGIFCFKAGVFLQELFVHAPEIHKACSSAMQQSLTGADINPLAEYMERIPAQSIDYAVLEKSDRVAVVPCSIGWSDLGSYDALFDYLGEDRDDKGNAVLGNFGPVLIDTRNSLVIQGDHKIALIGVEDLLVVQSPDALLISHRGRSQQVKQVVDTLRTMSPGLVDVFPRLERPWGRYTLLDEGPGYRVGKVEIDPGKRLSMHIHNNRDESWMVVAGSAGLETASGFAGFKIGEVCGVTRGQKHRLSNTGTTPLILMETRIGEILDDTDIQRIEDDNDDSH